MEKKITTFFALFFLFLFLAVKVSAVSISTFSIDKSNVTLQESFQITAKIIEGSVNTNYFIKCRIGVDSSSLNEGQTYSPLTDSWLFDTDAWTKMPQITSDDNGSWEGTIACRVKNSATTGDKIVVSRACLNNSGACSDNFQSANSILIKVAASAPTEILSPAESLSSTLAETTPSPTSIGQLTDQSQISNNIYLSEVMIDPETGSSEWIEIYNDNNYEVALSNWYIDDIENSGTTPKLLSLTIPAGDYASYNLSSSMFNNDGDSVRLLDFNQLEIDSFQYQSSEKGKTLGRTAFDSDSFCPQTPTKNTPNGPCLNPIATPTPKSTTSSASILTPSNTLLKTPTINKTPTKNSSTVTPKKISLLAQNQQSISDSPEETNKEVLGVTTQNEPTVNSRTRALLSSLSFASLAYSTLSIISILIKLKMNS